MTDAVRGYSTHRLYATRHANGRSIRVLRPFGACRHRPCAARGLGAAAARRSAGSLRGATQRPHPAAARHRRSEEHTSELQSLMRISYAVFRLKKKRHIKITEKVAKTT